MIYSVTLLYVALEEKKNIFTVSIMSHRVQFIIVEKGWAICFFCPISDSYIIIPKADNQHRYDIGSILILHFKERLIVFGDAASGGLL